MNSLKKNSGFSLIELMIAMVLGLMLSAGIFSVFSGNKRSTDLNSAMANPVKFEWQASRAAMI